ncbi:hypothetical protein EV193_101355 [Herbihabitans rhizosphaerae]|uniref:WXG100 family type VII secretion target n=1 Tax=Herbihabitans rhizosphaerae TaxID=1872711 RepID=A0A4Q7L4C5_9PSEU|nr:hypothetical protein [Herbihabitans rhizosphaerae]RZS44479.1 hypothetical protein EV193_101355 [Herbihabitans rhizosphaerae]
MGFTVEPAEIGAFEQLVERQYEHTLKAAQYVSFNCDVPGGEKGLLNEIWSSTDEVKKQVMTSVSKMGGLARASAIELGRTAEYYRGTDRREAERLDRTYPGPSLPRPPVSVGDRTIREVRDPSGRLSPPEAPGALKDPIPQQAINAVSSFFSPGYWTMEVLNMLLGTNPAQELANLVTGDWQAFARCANAFDKLAKFYDDVATNLDGATSRLRYSWQGQAADNASTYFDGLGKTIREHKSGMEKLRDAYTTAAEGVWQFAEAAKSLILKIFDKVFWIVIEWAAARILGSTVVGPAALMAISALQCKEVVDMWNQVGSHLSRVQRILRTFYGNVLAIIGTTGSFAPHPFPAGAYKHPATVC